MKTGLKSILVVGAALLIILLLIITYIWKGLIIAVVCFIINLLVHSMKRSYKEGNLISAGIVLAVIVLLVITHIKSAVIIFIISLVIYAIIKFIESQGLLKDFFKKKNNG